MAGLVRIFNFLDEVCSTPVQNKEHQQQRLKFFEDFTNRFLDQGPEFLLNIVTIDESWVPFFTPELKKTMQWLPRGSRNPVKGKTQGSSTK